MGAVVLFAVAMPPVAVAMLVCLLLGLAGVAFAASARPTRSQSASAASASTPGMLSGLGGARVAAGAAVAVLVLLATRWLALAVLAGGMATLWGRLLHDRRADEERRRVEGIAKWLEDLRDTLRGSAMGAEEALEHVAARPPVAIAAPLHTFLLRRRQGFRTEDALADLGEALAHPTADAAIAAIRLVVSGTAGAGRLYPTVNALAAAARDEVSARERVDRTRAVYQTSMKRLVIIGGGLLAYLRFMGGDLLDPYSTPAGQVVLLFPLGMWLGCVLWLRSLCRYDLPRRAVQVSS
ncbi:MAG TPA: hypothetical protein DCR14_06940 [Acidimicrobiaceae bacterium]|nr:hypothetical protein [Acidimicrobiaceae bacterium]